MIYDIAVFGDCIQDIFILSDSRVLNIKDKGVVPKKYLAYEYGEKIGVNDLKLDLGGSACNSAVAMRNIGCRVNMASVLGDDFYSKKILKELKDKKVSRSFIVREKDKEAGLSFILLGPDRDRSILVYRTKSDYSRIKFKKVFTLSKSIYIADVNRYSKKVLKEILYFANKTKKPLYINPSAFQIENDRTMLKKLVSSSEIFFSNVEEAKKILGYNGKDIKEILKKFKKMGANIVVVTDGKKGAYCYNGEKFFKSGIYPAERVDATGAGDSFAATFVAMHRKGFDIEDCLKFATINSASVISVYGAQKGLLKLTELNKRFKKGKVKVREI